LIGLDVLNNGEQLRWSKCFRFNFQIVKSERYLKITFKLEKYFQILQDKYLLPDLYKKSQFNPKNNT